MGEPPSADEEEPKGAALQSGAAVGDVDGAADGGGGGDVSTEPANGRFTSARGLLSRRYGQRAEEYEALLSNVTKSSKRAKLMSVQGVLFGFTFMMSTFETSNR